MMILKTVFREGWLRQMNKHLNATFKKTHEITSSLLYMDICTYIYIVFFGKRFEYKKCVPEYEYFVVYFFFPYFNLLIFQNIHFCGNISLIFVITSIFFSTHSKLIHMIFFFFPKKIEFLI